MSTFDLEAQTSTAIAAPSSVSVTQNTRAFSAADLSGTRESRHDQHSSYDDEALPAYFEAPPAYSRTGSTEPITLAMYLFKFGFLFPPFWIMGAIILLTPLEPPASSTHDDNDDLPAAWLPEKTNAERQEIVQRMRETEMKWANRCLVALFVLTLVGLTVGLTTWAVLRRT